MSGLAEPVGAMLGLYAAYLSAAWVPSFLSFAAGAKVFVSLHELVPMARRYGFIPMFILGIIASIAFHSMPRVFLPE